MAATNAKPKKRKASNAKKKNKLDVQAVAVVGNIVFTKTDMWAYYRMPNQPYDFLSQDERIQVAGRMSLALNALMTERVEPLDVHLIGTNFPIDVEAWYQQALAESEPWDRTVKGDSFLAREKRFLEAAGFLEKRAYIGVHLGKRGETRLSAGKAFDAGVEGALRQVQAWSKELFKMPGEEISRKEEAHAQSIEKTFQTIMRTGGMLGGERAATEDILLLLKRALYPAMPVPYLDIDPQSRVGAGDIALEMASVIRNKLRWLEIDQIINGEDHTGYRAALTVARTEKYAEYPHSMIPLFQPVDAHGLEFTTYARITLLPSQKMKKDLEKQKAQVVDGSENWASGDTLDKKMGILPKELTESFADIDVIETAMNEDGRTPWVQGTYRIIVTSDNLEELKSTVDFLRQRYSEIGVTLSWSAGDQAKILLEQMPGDHVRSKSYMQTTNLNFLSTIGINLASSVGDPIKPLGRAKNLGE